MLYGALFPEPSIRDPASFSAYIAGELIPEVRLETATFYGSLDCLEAQYPGLDYTYAPHRMRLSRYPWHARLFKAFDALRLTDSEIASLCTWEGTKSARERYEKEEGVAVRDTTADGVAVEPLLPPSVEVHYYEDKDEGSLACGYGSDAVDDEAASLASEDESGETSDCSDEGDVSDDEAGVALGARVQPAARSRQLDMPIPQAADWELFLKDNLGITPEELDSSTVELPPWANQTVSLSQLRQLSLQVQNQRVDDIAHRQSPHLAAE